jgi:hypothetical protein
MSGPLSDDFDRMSDADKIDELRNALKETVINLERLTEQPERILQRARERLEALTPEH